MSQFWLIYKLKSKKQGKWLVCGKCRLTYSRVLRWILSFFNSVWSIIKIQTRNGYMKMTWSWLAVAWKIMMIMIMSGDGGGGGDDNSLVDSMIF